MAKEKRKLMTYQQWANVVQNPPTSWDDYNMDWDNPNPQDSVYWIAIAQAMRQRWCVISSPNYRDYDLFRLVCSIKYQLGLNSKLVKSIVECIEKLCYGFVDESITDYSFCFVKQLDFQFQSQRNFPQMYNIGKIFQKYPIIGNLKNRINSHITLVEATEFLKAVKQVLCLFRRTPSNYIWGRHIPYSAAWYGYEEDLDQMMQYIEEDQQRWKQYRGNGYYYSTFGYTPEGNWYNFIDGTYHYVGFVGYTQVRRRKDQGWKYQKTFEAYVNFVNDYAMWNPLNLKARLYNYVNVSTAVDIPQRLGYGDDGEPYGDKYIYKPNTFGFQQGLNIIDLGIAPTDTTIDIDTIRISDIQFPSWGEIPLSTWNDSQADGNPDINHFYMVGCRLIATPILDFTVEGGFKFK